MGRPDNVYEYDAYPMPNIPSDRKPLTKEEEDKLVSEMKDRIKKLQENVNPQKTRKIS